MRIQALRQTGWIYPAPHAPPGQGDRAAGNVPAVAMPKSMFQAWANRSPLAADQADELVTLLPSRVAEYVSDERHAPLRRLVISGVRQMSPGAGRAYDATTLIFGGVDLVQRWADREAEDPVSLVIDTVGMVADTGALGAEIFSALAPYKTELAAVGIACAIGGMLYKGWGQIGSGTAAEQHLLGEVQATVLNAIAPAPAAFAHHLTNATRIPPPLPQGQTIGR